MTPTLSPSLDPLVGRVLSGRYRLLERLAQGATGAVYRAVQEPLGREVAVKVLRVDLDEEHRAEFQARFEREAGLAARLSHPNCVTVHDSGTHDGLPYVVMEHLTGRTLADAVQDGRLDPIEAARIGSGVARGLRHAHGNGLVHRDVKPSNILLVRDDDGIEQPMIVDFGLAKGLTDASTITRPGTQMGTPSYMAPEQVASDGEVDHRADIYALGCVLYRMVSGVAPFRASTPLGTALAHVHTPYPRIALAVPDVRVDPDLETLIVGAMQKDPDDRWQDAGELAAALDAWRRAQLPRAETTVTEPAVTRPRVAPLVLAGGVVLLVGLAAGLLLGRLLP